MAAGGPVDPTMPVPSDPTGGAGASGAIPGAYDETVAVPPIGPAADGGDPGGPYGGGPTGADDDGDNKKLWIWGALAVLGAILLGVLIALLVSGGGDKKKADTVTSAVASTSTSTSTSTSSTTSTTSTTVPGAAQITAYSSNPATSVSCPNNTDTIQVTLTWTTANATGVTITIDGGVTDSFGPNGSAARPFACTGTSHSYLLTAKGANNSTATRTITLTKVTAPTTAPPPTTIPPTTTSH